MATRFISSGLTAPDGIGNVAGIAIGTSGQFEVNRGPDFKSVQSADPGAERVPISRYLSVTASTTITHADHGATIGIAAGTSFTVTLPATQKGLNYTFVLEGVASGGIGHNVDPAAADKITGNGLALADGVSIKCTQATNRTGDSLTLVGDGADGWYITAVTGTWAQGA